MNGHSRSESAQPFRLLVCLVAVPILSGCFAPSHLFDGPTKTINVPWPTHNATLVYADDHGRRLNVTVQTPTTRWDAYRRTRPGLRLDWTLYTPADGTFRFEEVVDRDGRIIQQVAECGQPDNRRIACQDERALVMLAGLDLPGAFGTAPFWNDTVATDDTPALSVANPLLETTQLTYRTQHASPSIEA